MYYKQHVVIDLEFTPIPKSYKYERSIVKNEIIQIGAVLLDEQYRKISTYSTYVKPQYAYHIKDSVTELTGIEDADVENAPVLEDAMKKLVGWIGDEARTRIYSWSNTDLYQLEDECYLKGIGFPTVMGRWMDFQRIYGRLIGSRHHLSLKNAMASANGQFVGTLAHTALYDAMATAELLILVTSGKFEEQTKELRAALRPESKRATLGEMFGNVFSDMLAGGYA